MEARTRIEPAANHLVMVELVGPRLGRPATDHATTIPFQREDLDTDRVLLVAPIEDESTAVDARAPMRPVSLAASANLVAAEHAVARRRTPVAHSRLGETMIASVLLVGALASGVGLAFLIAAVVG